MALTAVALLCWGCSGSEEALSPGAPGATDDGAISFSTGVTETDTRAFTGPIDNLEALKTVPEGFGVLAYLTDGQTWEEATDGKKEPYLSTFPSPDFMYNQPVTWGWLVRKMKTVDGVDVLDTENSIKDWVYSPLKYWPNSTDNATARYVSFFAYAPFVERSAMGSYGITEITNSADKRPYLVYKMDVAGGTNQVDVLWSEPALDQTRNGNGLIDEQPANKYGRYQSVPLTFKHALAAFEVYVQRVYDEPVYSGHTLSPEEHTKLFVNQLQFKSESTAADITAKQGLFSGGRLDLETGQWSSPTGADAWVEGTQTLTYGEGTLSDEVRGTQLTDPADLDLIRDRELNRWGDAANYGVIEQERLLLADRCLMLLPTGGDITIVPTLSYSMLTRDDELQLSALTDKDGHRYARIMNTVEGNPLTLTIQAGKKYKMVIRINAEHVDFEVVSVTDWDFPMRFQPGLNRDYREETIHHTLNEPNT